MDKDSLLSIVGIILSILVSLLFYVLQKKNKKLSICVLTTILISFENFNFKKINLDLKRLKIQYDGQDIKTLNSTKIIIKNIGNDMIEARDFASLSPLVIDTSGIFLVSDLSEYKIKCSNSVNKVYLEKINDTNLKIVFEFLNPNERIYINVLHTNEIFVHGTLKNGKIQIEKKENEIKHKKKHIKNGMVAEALIWLIGFLVVIGLYYLYVPY